VLRLVQGAANLVAREVERLQVHEVAQTLADVGTDVVVPEV
jgi:arginine repressor